MKIGRMQAFSDSQSRPAPQGTGPAAKKAKKTDAGDRVVKTLDFAAELHVSEAHEAALSDEPDAAVSGSDSDGPNAAAPAVPATLGASSSTPAPAPLTEADAAALSSATMLTGILAADVAGNDDATRDVRAPMASSVPEASASSTAGDSSMRSVEDDTAARSPETVPSMAARSPAPVQSAVPTAVGAGNAAVARGVQAPTASPPLAASANSAESASQARVPVAADGPTVESPTGSSASSGGFGSENGFDDERAAELANDLLAERGSPSPQAQGAALVVDVNMGDSSPRGDSAQPQANTAATGAVVPAGFPADLLSHLYASSVLFNEATPDQVVPCFRQVLLCPLPRRRRGVDSRRAPRFACASPPSPCVCAALRTSPRNLEHPRLRRVRSTVGNVARSFGGRAR
jgi:hypothetical protein